MVEKLKGYLFEKCETLDVISMVGMGGIGKTTLAERIFDDPEIQYEFPARMWVTASQEFSLRSALLGILKEFNVLTKHNAYYKTDMELAELVSDYLGFAKFLLVLDDVWSTIDWDQIRCALPENNNGKVLITSRVHQVGQYASFTREPHRIPLLSRAESWLLLRLEIFGKPECPSETEEVHGKKIADICRGLPFAIVLVGGLIRRKLAESNAMEETLKKLLRNANNSNFEYNPVALVVHLCIEKLPRHLNKCFIYLGMFLEDYEIPAWKLIRMWIAEGFIQQEEDNHNMSLEETAEKYLDEFINSNLLTVHKFNAEGKVIKTCRIHDLIRDVCLYKAHKEATDEGELFFHQVSEYNHGIVSVEHNFQRLSIHSSVLDFLSTKPCHPNVRSFVCFSKKDFGAQRKHTSAIAKGFKLLRVLDIMPLNITSLSNDMYRLLHLRYMALSFNSSVLPVAFSKFRNIQTMIVGTTSPTLDVRADIFGMTELRHFKTNASATLLDPTTTSSEGGDMIQTLGMISPESCTEQFFQMARNLKELSIRGKLALLLENKNSNRSFDSLGKLENLEKLKLINDTNSYTDDDTPLRLTLPPADKFPIKLRSLTLCGTFLGWSDMSVLGTLENLEVLKLKDNAFQGEVWKATDGGFPHLEFLQIERADLKIWVASQDHFPRLKHLVLRYCLSLRNLPVELADVPSFARLDLYRCIPEAASCARKIHEAKKKLLEELGHEQFGFSLNISK